MIDTTTLITITISIVSVSAAIYFGLKSSRRNDTKDIEARATNNAVINVKLDNIANTVNDIKYDISALKKQVADIDKRLVMVEASAKSAHHRLDTMEGKEDRNDA